MASLALDSNAPDWFDTAVIARHILVSDVLIDFIGYFEKLVFSYL